MQVSEKCVKLLKSFNISALKSNVLIADLKTIQYGIVDEKSDPSLDYDNYWHKPLSKDMLNLVDEWKDKQFSEDLFLILNTNLKLDVVYIDPDGKDQTKTSEESPKIRLNEIPVEEPPKQEEPPKDDTVAPEPLPNTGAPIIIGIISIITIATIFFAKKYKNLNF